MHERSEREEDIFEQARKLSNPAKRREFVRSACDQIPELVRKVEALLAANGLADDFFTESRIALEAVGSLPIPEMIGDRIARYRLLERIGEGGCGTVYRAEQEGLVRRQVALKVIKLGMDTEKVVARFEAEREALALMEHPNIAKVLDGGATEAGRPYFVMELVRGTNLTAYCQQHRLAMRARLEIFVQVCSAVQHAHQKGIIHRDLKPSNILVVVDQGVPVPKVIDFGIAKAMGGRLTEHTLLTASDQFLGTPAYTSPEQATLGSSDVDTRSDIYSLGVLLYELLTGKTPFDTKALLAVGLDELRRNIQEEEPVPPSTRLKEMAEKDLWTTAEQRQSEAPRLVSQVRGELDWIVMKCLEKDRVRRYQTVNALAMDVKRYLANEPILARPPSSAYRMKKFLARHTAGVITGFSLLFLLVGGATLSTWEAFRARRAEKEQSRQRVEAERARARSEHLSGRLQQDNAEMLFAVNDAPAALANLARMIRENPSNQIAATRLISALAQRSFFIPTSMLLSHDGDVKSVQFNRRGDQLATASLDRSVKLWDATSGELLRHFNTEEPATWASFSPDGKTLAVGTWEGNVQLWRIQPTELMATRNFGPGVVSFVDFSPDGRRLAVAAGTVHVWRIDSPDDVAIELPVPRQATWARFSSDGEKIATASTSGIAEIWNASDGSRSDSFKQEGRLWVVEFSPDQERLLVVGAAFAGVYDLRTRKRLYRTPEYLDEVYWGQFTADGSRVVVKSFDRTVRVFDGFTGAPVGEPLVLGELPNGSPNIASLSPDARHIAIGFDEKFVGMWQVPFGPPVNGILSSPFPEVAADVKFSRDGRLLAKANRDSVEIWDVPLGRMVQRLHDPDAQHMAMEFSADSQWLATGGWNREARIWNARTGEPRTDWLYHAAAINSVHFSPDGRRLLTGAYGETAQIWDAETGELLLSFRHSDEVTCANFSADGARVVTTSRDKSARVWDAYTGKLLSGPLLHQRSVFWGEFSRDGEWIATASADKTARVWNSHTGQPLTAPIEHKEAISVAHFSADGGRLLTAGFDDKIARVWNLPDVQSSAAPLQHLGNVWRATFDHDGDRVLTVSADQSVNVWDGVEGQRITEKFRYGGVIYRADFGANGEWLAAACDDGAARIWELPRPPLPVPAWLATMAEGLAGQRFDQRGGLVSVTPERLASLRGEFLQSTNADFYSVWARWFFTAPDERSLTPSSSQKMSDYVQFLEKQNTVESLREALSLQPANARIMARLARSNLTNQLKDQNTAIAEVEWLVRSALALDPKQPIALCERAEILLHAGKLQEALNAINQALTAEPGDAEYTLIRERIIQKLESRARQ